MLSAAWRKSHTRSTRLMRIGQGLCESEFPGNEIPVGAINLPIAFTSDQLFGFDPLPVEIRSGGRWKRIGYAPYPRQKPQRKAYNGPTAGGTVRLVAIRSTAVGQQVRLGAGVLDQPIVLTTTRTAVVPDLSTRAVALGSPLRQRERMRLLVGHTHTDGDEVRVRVLAEAGTPILPETSALTAAGSARAVPPIGSSRSATPTNSPGPPDRAHVWRSAMTVTRTAAPR